MADNSLIDAVESMNKNRALLISSSASDSSEFHPLLKSNLNCNMDIISSTQIAAVIPSSNTSTTDVHITNSHPVPRPGEGEVLVKLEFSGVSHSDMHSIRRDTPMPTNVAGHEGIGKMMQSRQNAIWNCLG